MNALSETAVLNSLSTKWLGRVCHYEPVVGSTNALLKGAVAAGTAVSPPTGTLYLTDYQTQGRGRLQRQWQAPAGSSLLFSLLFRPDWPGEQANWLTMLTSLAAVEAIEAVTAQPGQASVKMGIKWPNDLMLYHDAAWRKVGGILLEGNLGANGRLVSVIVGLGLNVNIPAEQLPAAATPATSLLAATGRLWDRVALLVDLLERLEVAYETAVSPPQPSYSPHIAWSKRLLTLNQPVRVTIAAAGTARIIDGTAVGTDHWGSLLVRTASGTLHTVTAGDVTLRC